MNKDKQVVDMLYNAINNKKPKTSSYDTTATVKRVKGNTAWVHIPGGIDETPVKMTVNAQVGDTVQVRVGGGRAWLTGNATAPPTDDKTAYRAMGVGQSAAEAAGLAWQKAEEATADAYRAREAANRAELSAHEAAHSANEAQKSATNANEYASRALGGLSTVQSVEETLTWITQHGTMALTSDTEPDPTHVYFILDQDGDYVVGNTHYSLVIEPDPEAMDTYYELTIDESLNNYVGTHLALTGEGLWLLPADISTNPYKVLIATGAGTTYPNAGLYVIDQTGGVLASFRTSGINIGEPIASKSRVVIDTNGFAFVYRDTNNDDRELAHMGYFNSGLPFFTFGERSGNAGSYSVGAGVDVEASGYASHAEGENTSATDEAAHAEGYYTEASGEASHAEGYNTIASQAYAHAEGSYCEANGVGSHAEGLGSEASNTTAHAEGDHALASGQMSHAHGDHTTAQGYAQTVIGRWNLVQGVPDSFDNTDLAFIIGNGTGTGSSRSNAFAVDWKGNTEASGDITVKKHVSPIGTVKVSYASAENVATATNTNLTSLSLEAGTWVLTGGVRFPNNGTGYRRMNISTTSASQAADVQLPAVNGASTQLAYTVIVSPTSTTTYYLNCYHDAGTTLSLVAGGAENGLNFLRAVRIA